MGGQEEKRRTGENELLTNEGRVGFLHDISQIIPGHEIKAKETISRVDLGAGLAPQLDQAILGQTLGEELPEGAQEGVDVGLGGLKLCVLSLEQQGPQGVAPFTEDPGGLDEEGVILRVLAEVRRGKMEEEWLASIENLKKKSENAVFSLTPASVLGFFSWM